MTTEELPDTVEVESRFVAFLNNNLRNTLGDKYFTLTAQTLESLDILPKLKPDLTPDNSTRATSALSRTNTTVYSVLDKCRTKSGKRLLAIWLQCPLTSKEKINTRLDIVQHFANNTQPRHLCYDDTLKKVPDLLRLAFNIEREKCNLTHLMKVYNSFKSVNSLCNNLKQYNSISGIEVPDAVEKLFDWIKTSCDNLGDFNSLIENSVDLSGTDENNQYLVRPDSDENIARVSLEIQEFCKKARKILVDVADDINLETDKGIKLETDPEKGFALRVTKANEHAVRGNSSYQQLSLVKKDGYRFTNNALTKLSSKYVCAKDEYKSLANNVISDIISKAVMYSDEVSEFGVAVTVLDTFIGLSVAAVENNYSRPLIFAPEEGRIELDQIRHPCLENQPDVENYVPNDLSLDKDKKKFYLITGPNMGGKSTFIKSAAICCIMAQSGSLIPASDGKLSVTDGVFTRVGASDRQMDGVSTFMEEMLDMSVILKKATEHSFVVIDELGRGTSTFDGYGLAYAISKHLAEITKCYTLFATHFHELTEMEESIDTVGNLHVKAICQNDKLTMLYSIDHGVCSESYSINVATFTNFPEHVVEMARKKLKQFEEVPGFADKEEVRDFIRGCVNEYMSDRQKT